MFYPHTESNYASFLLFLSQYVYLMPRIFVLRVFFHLNCLCDFYDMQNSWCSQITGRKVGLWVVDNPAQHQGITDERKNMPLS